MKRVKTSELRSRVAPTSSRRAHHPTKYVVIHTPELIKELSMCETHGESIVAYAAQKVENMISLLINRVALQRVLKAVMLLASDANYGVSFVKNGNAKKITIVINCESAFTTVKMPILEIRRPA
jgi:acetamidase/formamidase